jgi:hypothetical protein
LAGAAPSATVAVIISQSAAATTVFLFMFDQLLSGDTNLLVCARHVLGAARVTKDRFLISPTMTPS